jgi:MFS family permease
VVSSLLGFAGIALAWSLVARRKAPAGAAVQSHERQRGRLIERGVLVATGLNLCSTLVSPSVMAFLPLYARTLGIENIGLFYVLAGATSIVIRPLLGKKSDSIGRGPAIAIGLASQLAGLVLIVAARDIALILAGGFFVAVGMSMIGSTTTALAMDLANPANRGRSMATFSMSFQIGVGTGAIISGALADLVSLRGMYVGSVAITLVGLALLASAWKSLPRPG